MFILACGHRLPDDQPFTSGLDVGSWTSCHQHLLPQSTTVNIVTDAVDLPGVMAVLVAAGMPAVKACQTALRVFDGRLTMAATVEAYYATVLGEVTESEAAILASAGRFGRSTAVQVILNQRALNARLVQA
jgi:hypothetical protein